MVPATLWWEISRVYFLGQCLIKEWKALYREKETKEENSAIKIQAADTLESTSECERRIQETAAIKIQTAFRGYLVSFAAQAPNILSVHNFFMNRFLLK